MRRQYCENTITHITKAKRLHRNTIYRKNRAEVYGKSTEYCEAYVHQGRLIFGVFSFLVLRLSHQYLPNYNILLGKILIRPKQGKGCHLHIDLWSKIRKQLPPDVNTFKI
jgi:hypothetical protein